MPGNIGDDPGSPSAGPENPFNREHADQSRAMDDEGSEDGLFVEQDNVTAEIKPENRSERGSRSPPPNPEEGLGQEHKNNDDDDSDECMEIAPGEIPENIKARFAEFKFGQFPNAAGDVICMGSARVKEEEHDDDFGHFPYAYEYADSEFVMDEDDELSDGEGPRSPRRRATKRQRRQREKTSELETEAWKEPTEEELMELCMKQEALNEMKSRGTLSLADKLALAKINARIAAVERRAQQEPAQPVLGPADGDDDDGIKEEVNRALAVLEKSLPKAPTRRTHARPSPARTDANTDGQNVQQGPKVRVPAPKSAREYWERRYAEEGAGLRNIAENQRKRKRPLGQPNKSRSGKKGGNRESKLMSMLKESNPIMARAAQGAMAMPGAMQVTRQDDQIRAMKDLWFKINNNLNPRSRPPDMKALKDAIKSFGARQVRAVDGRWKLKGMKSTLFNHQLVGVSWMLCQEFSPNGPYGGILADQMGLGKTVQILATMSANRPSKEDIDAGRHQTLIVAPAAAIDQWKQEIKRHCEESFIKRIHHYKLSQNLDESMWKSADIILVSYHEVANSYSSEKALKRIAGKKLDDEEWAQEFEAELGELFRHEFFRVVLDEGHLIRNHQRKTSQACINLTSKYRWILTGTPLHNSVDEFFPYFRFLGAHWADDRDEFSKQFGDIDKDGTHDRMMAVLTSIMLRRRVDDRFLGVPILEIPRTHEIVTIEVDFTAEERLISRRFDSRVRDIMCSDLKAGVAHKKLTTYLAYLTRSRQLTAHLFLLEGTLKNNLSLEDISFMRKKLKAMGGRTPMHRQLANWLKMEYEGGMAGGGEDGRFGKSRFGYHFDMDAQLEEIEAGKSIEEVTCRLCYDTPDNPKITECGHTFCQDCIAGRLKLEPTCPTCQTPLFQLDNLEQPEGGYREQSDEEDGGKRSKRGKKKTKRKKKEKREIGDDENWAQPKLRDRSKWLEDYDKNYPKKELLASAKTIAVKNQVLTWQREAPDDKIIVFVNWAKLACIIGRMLSEEGIPFLYYFGDLTADQKAAAISDFWNKPHIKVLIASIRCGGQSLNLTCANRVILVDQWWNKAMENQAFGRVQRIGQQKEMHFVRIVVKDSIDIRLLQVQDGKEKRIGKVLEGDADYKKASALGLAEMLRLFGLNLDGSLAAAGEGLGEAENEVEEGVIVLSDDEESEDEGDGGVIVLSDDDECESEAEEEDETEDEDSDETGDEDESEVEGDDDGSESGGESEDISDASEDED